MKDKGCVFLLAQPLLHRVDVVVVREGRYAPLPPDRHDGDWGRYGGMDAAGGGMGGAAGMDSAAAAGMGMGMGMRQNTGMGMMGGVGRGRPGINQGPGPPRVTNRGQHPYAR